MYYSLIHNKLTKYNFLTDAGCQIIKSLAQKYTLNICVDEGIVYLVTAKLKSWYHYGSGKIK